MSPEREPEVFTPAEGAKTSFDFDEIHRRIQKYFKVYEVERDIRGVPGGEIAAFYVQTNPATFGDQFEELRQEIRALDPELLVILQHKMGEDLILVARKPRLRERGPSLNVVLLVLTILTTTISGALFYQEYDSVRDLLRISGVDASFLHPRMLGLGFLTFSLPLIFILGVHELGHYFVARRHSVRTSLPYFIPVPPVVPIGTFGAFISIREPIPDRKALFDIGAAGPIAGFLVAIPILVLGMVLTAVVGVPVPPGEEVHASLAGPAGNAWGFGADTSPAVYSTGNRTVDKKEVYFEEVRLDLRTLHPNGTVPPGPWNLTATGLHLREAQTVHVRILYVATAGAAAGPDFAAAGPNYTANLARELAEGEATSATYTFSLPSDATALTASVEWKKPASRFVKLGDSLFFLGTEYVVNYFLPSDENLLTHPTGIAGWVGLLVTGFNLLPAGQLDGGHVARAVLGDRMKWASYAAIALMFVLSLRFTGWLVMAVLIVLLGVRHPPPLNDKSPLDPRRRFLAALVLLVLIVTFIPFPFVPT